MKRLFLRLATVLALSASAVSGALHDYESLLNWADLPRDKSGGTVGLASSYDRAGQNLDFNHYLEPEGWQTTETDTVVTELTGPGIITRFWMPHAAANEDFTVRMIVDGVTQIDTNSDVYLGGDYGYADSPLVSTLVGGQVSYEPIAFGNSLRIESNNFASGGWVREHHYYQYNYRKLPLSRTVTPYNGSLTTAQQTARNSVVAMIENVGSNPAGTSGGSTVLATPARDIAAGGVLELGNLTGSGRIRRLNLKMPAGASDAALDGLRLRVRYDGQQTEAIDVPVSHFFGAGHDRVAYQSLPLGTDSPDGFYCYWPMPYRQAAVVELYNGTGSAISIDSAAVEYETGAVPHDEGYLHAVYTEETTVTGQSRHNLLNVPDGRGHYVGNLLFIEKAGDSRSILEGDDIITVNPGTAGEVKLYGTGLEDAYNGGYYYNHIVERTDDGDVADPAFGIGPYHGLLYIDFFDMPGFTRTRTDQYRWMIGDYVPFTDGIVVEVENYGYAGVHFGSTAFYYAVPEPIPGDADLDGDVDDIDLALLLNGWGRSGMCWGDGDLTGEGDVDDTDLSLLLTNWGSSVAVTAVPEPAFAMLLAAGLPWVVQWHAGKRRRR